MVVAVASVRVVQVTVDDVANVVSVRHGFVSTARAMLVAVFMAGTVVAARAVGGIGLADFDGALVHMVSVGTVKVSVVEVAGVVSVLDGSVATAGAVGVVVVSVGVAGHGLVPFGWWINEDG